MNTLHQLTVNHIEIDIPIADLDAEVWNCAPPVVIDRYWSGEAAPAGRHSTAFLLWSDTALYVRFDLMQDEPLVVSEKPDISQKTIGLWDRDVGEIFIAPDPASPNRYFEFEVSPAGEWVDLAIEITHEGRRTNWDFSSGMTSSAAVRNGRISMSMKIPWEAFGLRPKAGNVWRGNLFRCVGKGTDRGYLAWQPTRSPKPSFHIPGAFGMFAFTADEANDHLPVSL